MCLWMQLNWYAEQMKHTFSSNSEVVLLRSYTLYAYSIMLSKIIPNLQLLPAPTAAVTMHVVAVPTSLPPLLSSWPQPSVTATSQHFSAPHWRTQVCTITGEYCFKLYRTLVHSFQQHVSIVQFITYWVITCRYRHILKQRSVSGITNTTNHESTHSFFFRCLSSSILMAACLS